MGLFLYWTFEKSHQMLHLNLLFPMHLLHKDLCRSGNAKHRKCLYFSDCSTSLSSLSYFFAIKHFSVLLFLRKLTCNCLCSNFFLGKVKLQNRSFWMLIIKLLYLENVNGIYLPPLFVENIWFECYLGVRNLLFLYNWNIPMHVIPTFRIPNYSLVFDVFVCQAKYTETYTDIKCYFNIPTVAYTTPILSFVRQVQCFAILKI